MKKDDCIFCKIANGDFKTEFILETEDVVAFRDINPQAPEHILVIPKEHYENIQNDLEIELVGVCTDICVISNAMIIKANLPEARITVDSSLCAGVTIESHLTALKAMEMCQIKIK